MIVILTLGGVVFQDFEIPEKVPGGGEQVLDIKKQLGGIRTINAMGVDDKPITWTGRFRGETAVQRLKQIDVMRRAGQPIKLTYNAFSYTVLIGSFTWDFQAPFEIPYEISLTILTDDTAPLSSPSSTIDAIVNSDLGQALDLGDALTAVQGAADDAVVSLGLGTSVSDVANTLNANVTAIVSDLNGLQTTLATVQRLTGSNSTFLNTLSNDVDSAQGVAQTGIEELSGYVTPVAGTVFGSTAGLPPQTIVSNLAGQAAAFQGLANLYPLTDILGRMSKNISSIGP